MRELAASDLVRHLRDGGWTETSSSDFGSMWAHASGVAVGVPGQVTEDSFEWAGIIERIAGAERRTPAEIALRLQRLFTDVTLLRAVGDTAGASIPIDAAERLLVSGRQLVRSAATTARTPKAVIGSSYSKPGDEIAATARVGYTRAGSYVVPILMPLTPSAPAPAEEPALGADRAFEGLEQVAREPAERRVTRTLAQALVAIQNRIVEPAREPTAASLADLYVAGVSREAVVAVHRTIAGQDIAQVDVSFEWAGAVKEPAAVPSQVRFPSESAPLLHRAATLMRPVPRRASEGLTGMIVFMRKGDPFDEFGLQTVRHGRPTEVQVTISSDRRDDIISWYRSGETVVVDGNVEAVRGKKPRIDGPQRVHALKDNYLFVDG